MITAKDLKEYSKHLNVLYVEDDVDLRENTTVLLSNLFKKVVTAEDGFDGIEKYKNEKFDIVITDINMPVSNGIEMIKKIKKIEYEAVIIVTSAHDEAEYLIPLIDLGVDSFILKPIELQKFLTILFKISRNIADKKLLEEYETKLEESILELDSQKKEVELKNHKLEKLNRILELKITQLSNCVEEEKKIIETEENLNNNERKIENYLEYVLDNDVAELKDFEEELDAITSMISLKNSITVNELIPLSQLLNRYGLILVSYPIFLNLGSHIVSFAKEIDETQDISNDIIEIIITYLESFIFTLIRWRREVFDEGLSNANIYDASMINDLNLILNTIKGIEEEGSGITLF